jgi:hypothetical protein
MKFRIVLTQLQQSATAQQRRWPWLRHISAIVLAVVTASLVTLASCSPQAETPLRIGTLVWPGFENFFLAEKLEHYEEAPIRLVTYTSNTDQTQAFRNRNNQPTPLQADGVWKRICSQTAGLGCSFITSLQAAGNPPLID